MNIHVSPDLEKDLKRIKSRDIRLFKQIQKQITLFAQNQKHPSLRVHKLTGSMKNLWSISIDRNIRMLFIIDKNEIIFFEIGTHDQVYR